MNILEAKLTSEHRNDLPDSEFGLPKDRKYPLNDESHIKSAIQFFKYAKPEQRRELAKNINLKLKKFNMKIKVSENNPFYKYIDRNYLSESLIFDNIITESSFSYVKGTNPNKFYDKIISDLILDANDYIDKNFIIESEKYIHKIVRDNRDITDSYISFISDINSTFEIIYEDYYKYKKYSDNNNLNNLYYPLLKDFREIFLRKIYSDTDVIDLGSEYIGYIKFIQSVTNNEYTHNNYYLHRLNCEIYCNILYRKNTGVDFINIDLDDMYSRTQYIPTADNIDIYFKNISGELLSDSVLDTNNVYFHNVCRILTDKKRQLESELYIINKGQDNKLITFLKYDNLTSIQDIENGHVRDTISRLSGSNTMVKRRALTYVKGASLELSQLDLVRLSKVKWIDRIIYGVVFNIGEIWLCIHDTDVYIIARSTEIDIIVYKLIKLTNDVITYLVYGEGKPQATITNINFTKNEIDKENITIDMLTEGFSINEDGDIKITINPKKSYMDEYAETHRILVENFKNKNYEAMKQNIAFMFLLISIIEKDKRYIKREPDIVKARAFAINDFKTYLSYIQKAEPSFNFEKYYKESEFDKYVINIPKSSILGIKNLLKTIFM